MNLTFLKSALYQEYLFVMQNGQEESITGPCIQLHCGNPFVKKIVTKATWKYDMVLGNFINATPE